MITPGTDVAWQLGYRRTYVAVFTSCTDPAAPNFQSNPTYVADSLDGYYIEYEKTFQSSTAMGTRQSPTTVDANGAAIPYSTILRPTVSLQELFAAERVWFDGAKYAVYDAMKFDSTYQDSDNNQAIIDSINSTNYGAWNSSRYLNGEIGFTGVNYFRPGIVYNTGGTIIDMLATEITVGGRSHIGDQTVGPDLPFWVPGGYEIDSQIQTLRVYGGAGHYINGNTNLPLVRYPVKCTLWFRLKGST